jgi:hypothetical protein
MTQGESKDAQEKIQNETPETSTADQMIERTVEQRNQ